MLHEFTSAICENAIYGINASGRTVRYNVLRAHAPVASRQHWRLQPNRPLTIKRRFLASRPTYVYKDRFCA